MYLDAHKIYHHYVVPSNFYKYKTWHGSTNLMAWQHFQQVMNVEGLTLIVANLVLVRIHLQTGWHGNISTKCEAQVTFHSTT